MEFSERDTFFMSEALNQARIAFEAGEVPVGAVLVHQDQILTKSYNQRETLARATAHAEILVIEEACHLLKKWRLSDCELYVTLEPCWMCAGALWQARIGKVIFGALDPKGGAFGSTGNIAQISQLNHQIPYHDGCSAQESRELLQSFFRARRR